MTDTLKSNVLTKMGLGLAALCAVTTSAQAQIPVTDGAHIGQSIFEYALHETQHAAEIAQAIERLQQLQQTYSQLQQQYDTITGMRFEDLLSAGAVGQQQRQKLARVYRRTDEALGLGLPDSDVVLRSFYEGYGYASVDEIYAPGSASNLIERSRRDATAIGFQEARDAAENFPDHVDQIERLNVASRSAEDLKAEATLQTQAQTRSLQMQLDQQRMLSSMLNLQAAQANAQMQQELRMRKMFGASGSE